MLKKGLIITITLVVAVTMSVVVFGAPYTYNTQDQVSITLTIPAIKVLDMTSSTHAITWAEVTAADLDRTYMVKNAATSFVVDSNNSTGWQVTVNPNKGYFTTDSTSGTATDAEMPMTSLYYRSNLVTAGDMTQASITTYTFTPLATDASAGTVVDCSGATNTCQGKNAEFLVDYKISMDWQVDPDTYYVTLTYTLS